MQKSMGKTNELNTKKKRVLPTQNTLFDKAVTVTVLLFIFL